MEAAIRALILIMMLAAVPHMLIAEGYGSYSDEGFPVRPRALKLGVEPARAIDKRAGVLPIFIMGSDPESLAWVKANREYLQSRDAVGFLIEAQSDVHVQRIRQHVAYQVLSLLPDDRDLAARLNITHYPVFIDVARGRVLR